VAIVSTGIFYGLFAGRLRSSVGELPEQSLVVAARNLDRGTVLQTSDVRVSAVKGALKGGFSKPEELVGATIVQPVQQNEPILQDRVASRDAKAGQGAGGVPAGMRAVSIRVAESNGVVGLLRPGTKVDVQAVTHRETSAELRTILQNVEVLAVSPQPEPTGGNQPALQMVTVLTRAQDADLIALADSGARIRLSLRNPLDDATAPRRSLALASVFQSNSGAATTEVQLQSSKTSPVASALVWDHPIQLHVRALGISSAALGMLDAELDSKLTSAGGNDSLSVTAFRSDADADQLIRALEQKQELEIVSSWKLTAGVGRPISFRAGTGRACRLRVQFSPEIDSTGKLSLRVKPEISLQRGAGVETRKYAAGLRDDGSFLVRGLLKDQGDRQVLERLYPRHSWGGRQLVILVTSRDAKQSSTAALAHTNRGQ
jgi:Flp pilus assembly protein CpaB